MALAVSNQDRSSTTGIRLLRRPTSASRDPPSSHLDKTLSDPETISKIGAPIIRPVSNVTTAQKRLLRAGDKERLHDKHKLLETREDDHSRKDYAITATASLDVALTAPPSLDLDNEVLWPGMSVTSETRHDDTVPQTTTKGWSAIVKSAPVEKVLSRKKERTDSGGEGEENYSGPSDEEGELDIFSGDGRGIKEKRKKKKKRNKSGDQQQTPQEKKSEKHLQLDLFEYAKQAPIRPVLNRKDTKMSSKSEAGNTRNILDSTAPLMRRGKERETPKTKRPTQLRKIIDMEKARKKELREKGLPIPPDLNVMKTETGLTEDIKTETDTEIDSKTVNDVSTAAITQSHLETTPTDEMSLATPTSELVTSSSGADETIVPNTSQKRQIHGRKFREYCTHMVTNEINSAVQALLMDLVRFQDRQHQKDPVKAKSKRRFVCGLREVRKHLEVGKIKCVIFPPNLDPIQSTGGIDERVYGILSMCEEKEVQVVYAMTRRRLAVVLKRKFKIGCVGIFNYDGAEGHYRKMRKLVEDATELYHRIRTPSGSSPDNNTLTPGDPQTVHSVGDHSDDDEEYPSEPEDENENQDLWDKHLPSKKKELVIEPVKVEKELKSAILREKERKTDKFESLMIPEIDYESENVEPSITEIEDERIISIKCGTSIQETNVGGHPALLVSSSHQEERKELSLPSPPPPSIKFNWNINATEFIPSNIHS